MAREATFSVWGLALVARALAAGAFLAVPGPRLGTALLAATAFFAPGFFTALSATAFFVTPGPRFGTALCGATAFFGELTGKARPDACPNR
ncbi:MAG: hypothetical protein ABSC00_02850 [Acidimicrobiales bacterium]